MTPGHAATARFRPEALAALAREDRRKLVQTLLTESGSHIRGGTSAVAYDELILETRPLWRPRRVRVNAAARPSTQDDVDRLAEAVEATGEAEGVLLAALGVVGELRPPTTIMVPRASTMPPGTR